MIRNMKILTVILLILTSACCVVSGIVLAITEETLWSIPLGILPLYFIVYLESKFEDLTND